MDRRSTVIQSTTATGALAVGVLVYLLDRQPTSVYFIPDWITLANNLNPIFGEIGNYLPTFIHVYAFILLTTIIVAPSPAWIIPICAAWFAVDSLFELAQFTPIDQWIAGNVPDWFASIPFLENTSAYFISGTFDFLDLLSIAAGTAAAYLTIRITQNRRKHHAYES